MKQIKVYLETPFEKIKGSLRAKKSHNDNIVDFFPDKDQMAIFVNFCYNDEYDYFIHLPSYWMGDTREAFIRAIKARELWLDKYLCKDKSNTKSYYFTLG